MSRQRQLLGQTSYLLAALTVILAALLPRNLAIQIYRALLENAAGFDALPPFVAARG